MASPAAMVGMGASATSGILGLFGSKTNSQAQKLNIQGQLMSALGQAFGMEVQAQQYGYQANINRYQAAVADLNKQISEQNAEYSRDVGEVTAQIAGMKHRAELGSMTAQQGASGLDVNVGSAVKTRESMIELGYYDQQQARASAAKVAYGYEIEATMNEAQADVYRYTATENEEQAKNALTAAAYTTGAATTMAGQATKLADTSATVGMLGSLVSATGSVSSKWMDYQKTFG